MTDNIYELSGFSIASVTTSIVYSDYAYKFVEIAVFALVTGALGALGGHLMKILIKKITKNHEQSKEKTLG